MAYFNSAASPICPLFLFGILGGPKWKKSSKVVWSIDYFMTFLYKACLKLWFVYSFNKSGLGVSSFESDDDSDSLSVHSKSNKFSFEYILMNRLTIIAFSEILLLFDRWSWLMPAKSMTLFFGWSKFYIMWISCVIIFIVCWMFCLINLCMCVLKSLFITSRSAKVSAKHSML